MTVVGGLVTVVGGLVTVVGGLVAVVGAVVAEVEGVVNIVRMLFCSTTCKKTVKLFDINLATSNQDLMYRMYRPALLYCN